MSRTLFMLLSLLALLPSRSLAQTATPSRWDVAVTTGLFVASPGIKEDYAYRDDWFGTARGAVSVGRYWTPHLKTEVEIATSGEDSLYVQRLATVPGTNITQPYSVQEFSRFNQGSARVVWQFLDNQWLHPYLLAGISVDAERRRAFAPEPYRYGGDPRLLVPRTDESPKTFHRAGGIVGAGAKLYVSPKAFATTGVLVTYAKPATTVSFVLGFGFDF